MNSDFWKNKRVLVTGGNGFVGKNLMARLEGVGAEKIYAPRSTECDLTDKENVDLLFEAYRPHITIHLAGKVGGIYANKTLPGEFFYKNIVMGTLVLDAAYSYGCEKTVALAAGCGYPKSIEVPYSEEDFWKGLPDENTRAYSMAKKNLIIQSWAYREQYDFNSTILLPANLYGPHDNFDLEMSHVVPALIRKFVEAKERGDNHVVVWGTGVATREFLYVEDTVQAILDITEKCDESGPFNLGTGKETSIKELVETISRLVEFDGDIVWDTTKPNGQLRRFYDMSKFEEAVGYVPGTTLEEGLRQTIDWYRINK